MTRALAAGATAAGADRGARILKRVGGKRIDGDGRIGRAGAAAAGMARCDRMDANADGRLETLGMHEAAGAMMERRLAKRFERPGANGDGAVERGRFAGRAARRSGRLDGDGGGVPTRDEIEDMVWRGG